MSCFIVFMFNHLYIYIVIFIYSNCISAFDNFELVDFEHGVLYFLISYFTVGFKLFELFAQLETIISLLTLTQPRLVYIHLTLQRGVSRHYVIIPKRHLHNLNIITLLFVLIIIPSLRILNLDILLWNVQWLDRYFLNDWLAWVD